MNIENFVITFSPSIKVGIAEKLCEKLRAKFGPNTVVLSKLGELEDHLIQTGQLN